MDTEGAKLDNEVSIPLGTINTLWLYAEDKGTKVSIPLGTINTVVPPSGWVSAALFQFH